MRNGKLYLRVLSALMVALLVFAACDAGDDDPGASAGSDTPSASPDGAESPTPDDGPSSSASAGDSKTTVEVWFHQGEKLFVSRRSVPSTEGIGAAAVRALLEGPTAEESGVDVGTQIPNGTSLLGLNIANGLATVDLSSEYESGGGSLSMTTRLAQVVYTLTQFPTVKKVDLRLEGEPVEVFSGEGIVLDRPQRRRDYKEVLPAILVLTPVVGERSTSPLTVTGTANVFEATVSLRLVRNDGKVLVRDFTTATCGTGCRGTYEKDLSFQVSKPTKAFLEVFESSAKDGRPTNLVRIPVSLLP